jgi:hypothetical protein
VLSPEQSRQLAEFPPILQELVRAELAAGNCIEELGGGFPAPPVGACVRLAARVTTRPRENAGELHFYERNSSSYSGEFTDARRFYFVLEPPLPPEPAPDMDAIRAAREQRQKEADIARMARIEPPTAAHEPIARDAVSERIRKFRESMQLTYDRWHDGEGYALDVLAEMTPAERRQVEGDLLANGVRNWRDVEALAALATPAAERALREAFTLNDDAIRMALLSHATRLFSEDERSLALVEALGRAEIYGGLTQALLIVQEFHPPAVMDALIIGVLRRDGATAGQFAALLCYLFGKADSPFDWNLRPFFLRQTEDRNAMFAELCERLEIPGERHDAILSRGG